MSSTLNFTGVPEDCYEQDDHFKSCGVRTNIERFLVAILPTAFGVGLRPIMSIHKPGISCGIQTIRL